MPSGRMFDLNKCKMGLPLTEIGKAEWNNFGNDFRASVFNVLYFRYLQNT